MTWFCLWYPVFIVLGKHWRAGNRVAVESVKVLLPPTAGLLKTTFHQNDFDADENAVTSSYFGVDWMCSKVWVPKPPKRATALHLRDPKGLHWKLPTSCWWGHCNSWSLVSHFKFPIWSNTCISYNLIQVLINLIYRIKIQNFLSSDHSNTSRASED